MVSFVRACARLGWLSFPLLVSVLPTSSARAELPRLTAEIGTDVPLGVGASGEIELGRRARFGLGLLWTPAAYVAFADEVGQAVGGYDDVTSAIVRASTENALALRFRAGVRPFVNEGFYVDVVYTLLTLGGAFTSEDLAQTVGQTGGGGSETGFNLSSTIHQLGFELGWRFLLPERLALRVALGGSFTFAADVTAEAVGSSRAPNLARTVEDAGAQLVEDIYTAYVHVPVITVALGWDILSPPGER